MSTVAEPADLVLLRHGEAERMAARDELRALTLHGREQAHLAGLVLAGKVRRPVRVACSPYLRARETAALVAAALGVADVAVLAGITPDDDPQRALARIGEAMPEAGTLVVVTHMPLVGALFGLLVDGDARRAPGLGTACGALFRGELVAPGLMRLVHPVAPHLP